jgi:hypothetical protein
VNRKRVSDLTVERGYAVLARTWKDGDTIQLELPMPVQRIAAHPNVRANHGLLALQRGPLVYCLESADLPKGTPILQVAIPPDVRLCTGQIAVPKEN